jgi:CHAT domain-containing protein
MTRKLATTLFIGFYFFLHSASAQVGCDTARINASLIRSNDLLDSGKIQEALEVAQQLVTQLNTCRITDTLFYENVLLQIGENYHSIGAELLYRGFVNQSIDVYERRVALYKMIPGKHAEALADSYLYLSNALTVNDDRKLAFEVARTGLQIRQANNPNNPKIAAFYDRIVDNFLAMTDVEGALPYLKEWDAFQQQIGSKSSLQMRVGLANNWAMYYYNKGDLFKAIQILEDTLALYGERLRAKGTMAGALVGIAEFNLCEFYTIVGNYERSLHYAEKNVALFEKRIQQQNGRLIDVSHYTWCLAQSAKAAWGLYRQTNDTTWYNFAEARTQQTEGLIFSMRDRPPSNGFLGWMGDDIDIVANIVEVRQGMYAKTGGDKNKAARAFEALEASKTFAMQQFLHETYSLRWSGIPDTLYQQESDFRQEINDIETAFFMLRNKPHADSLIAANDQKLFALRDKYNVFLAGLEKNYPDYFRMKYSHPAVDLQQVQSKYLRPGQCILDLYIRNDLVFALLIRPDTLIWRATPYDSLAHKAIEVLKNDSREFQNYQTLPEAAYLKKLQDYADAAYKAYTVLIEPVRSFLSKEVLLIPRNDLSIFPFGALLTQRETNLAKPFLWHFLEMEFVMSETFSAGLFQFVQNRPVPENLPGTVLAFAPFVKENAPEKLNIPVGDIAALTRGEIYKPLPSSGEEAEFIAAWMNGEAFVGKEATKSNFLKKSPDFKILHLATHSAANDVLGEYSFVALQADNAPNQIDMLYARDIYGLHLSADLVVLSACETALGQFRNGEGVIGLTRAFTCAGARNVVASLWSVNDASTKELMLGFYKEIKKGTPYNQALAKAKWAFIQENKQFAHPYYWAGFVLNGR